MDSSEQEKELRQVALVSHPLHSLEGKHRVPLWISLMTSVRVSRWAHEGQNILTHADSCSAEPEQALQSFNSNNYPVILCSLIIL